MVGDEYRGIKVVGNEDEEIEVELEIGARSTGKKDRKKGWRTRDGGWKVGENASRRKGKKRTGGCHRP